MDRGRFSLLLLDPGEIYFEDFSATFVPPDATRKTYDVKRQEGRLKMCSKSLVFDPKDLTKPLIKITLKCCVIIEQWKGSAKFIESKNVLSLNCREYIEMLEGNVIAPYQFKESAHFLFLLNYADIATCLTQILQLQRASSLPSAEQSDMIGAIVHSRRSRVNFDPLWLDLYEKIIAETQADKICPLVINPGRVVLSTMRLYFQPFNNIEMCPVLKINLNSIKRVVRRRFLLRHIGLEIYSSDYTSSNSHIYLSFGNQIERDILYEKIIEQPELQLDNLEQDVITLQWQNGVISNFDYLLYINRYLGFSSRGEGKNNTTDENIYWVPCLFLNDGDRTVNDLTQYPVFPWVIRNYTGETLDLKDPSNYRDLSQPVGAINPERLQRLLDRYNEMSDPKFIYGSHYSTPGFVLYYLARLYPHYVLCMQGGRFDHADRMFNSVADAFKNCFCNMSDFKELIPEFYDVAHEEPSTSATRFCKPCKLEITLNRWDGHQKSHQHKSNCSVVQGEGVSLIRTSFRGRLATYRIEGTEDSTNVKKFLQNLKNKTIALVESNVNLHDNIKVGMELFGRFLLQSKEAMEVKSFNSKFRVVSGNTDLEELFDQTATIMDKKAIEFQEKDSGNFLINSLGINFGHRHNTVKVGNVEMPHWAESPKHFVEILRQALESDIVSNSLHDWIDLIFGYKQKGEEAIKANNLFYHLCYEGNVDLDSIEDLNERHALEVQIMEFGQIPKQVFTVPHPKRKVGLSFLTEPYEIEREEPILEDRWKHLTDLQLQTSFNSHKNTISDLFISEDCTKITSVGHDSKLKVFSLTQNRQTRSANIGNMPLSSCIQLPEANTLIIGSWDNQILVYDLDYGRVTIGVLAHEDAITCLSFGHKSNLLVSGSGDCSVKVWKGINADTKDLIIQCLYKHLDHNSSVVCACFDPENVSLAVGTQDGEIYLWETTNFTVFKKYETASGRINAMDYSPDGHKIAIGTENGAFQVLDVNTGMPVFSKTLKSKVCSLKWEGYLLAIGCEDGVLSLWDMFEVRILLELKAHSGSIQTVDIPKDRSIIVTGSQDKVIKVWKPICRDAANTP